MPAKENELDFSDLTIVELPVSIGDKKYVLREADGATACAYRNALMRCTKLGPDGKPLSMDGIADLEPLLVAGCLFTQTGEPVAEEDVRKMSYRVLKPLYAKAKSISGLDGGNSRDELLAMRTNIDRQLAELDKAEETEKNS
ncbi:MAG: hypothetical protein WC485_00125 [Opitutaceae bacterium]